MMDGDVEQNKEFSPAFVRDQLDEILAQQIIALLDVDSDSATLSFNLSSIACVTIIVDKEREIKRFTDFPPERYTKETFIKELIGIGLERDAAFEKTIHSILNKGYISTNSEGQLVPEMPSFMMVGFLDNMFPGMQGMNLVAFVLQMNEEVNSGRKTLELAKDSFKAALKSRGVVVSKDVAEEKVSELVSGFVAAPDESEEVLREQKKDNLNRLSKLIKKRKKQSIGSSDRLKIKDVFEKEPSKEELAAQKAEIEKAEQAEKKMAELARELAQKEEKIKVAQEAARQAEKQLLEIGEREKKLLASREALMAEKEAELKALEEKIKQEEEQQRQSREEQKQVQKEEMEKTSKADEDIESQILAFERELAMPCPLCKDGEVVSKTTEKGKEFFSCTKSDCRFVSWDKPYHFECPLCKNTFLTETMTPRDEKGLKCPRAACSYTQNNLYDPKQNMAADRPATGPAKKKKKRVVRRKRR